LLGDTVLQEIRDNIRDTIRAVLLELLIQFAEESRFNIIYDFQGMLRHAGFKNGSSQVEKVETKQPNPKVFVYYSWDSEKHKLWVLKLAAELNHTLNGYKHYRELLYYYIYLDANVELIICRIFLLLWRRYLDISFKEPCSLNIKIFTAGRNRHSENFSIY